MQATQRAGDDFHKVGSLVLNNQGLADAYQPAKRVASVPSHGLSHRLIGWKTGSHVVQLLSNNEYRFFLALEWSSAVAFIREQFALPLHETTGIANILGVRHPPALARPQPLTTDFVTTLTDGVTLRDVAWAVKQAAYLEDSRTRDKLEIERVFWTSMGVTWRVVTEREIDATLARNVEWVHGYLACPDISVPEEWENILLPAVRSGVCLRIATEECDRTFGAPPGTSLTFVKHLIASRAWSVDMYQPISVHKPLRIERVRGDAV